MDGLIVTTNSVGTFLFALGPCAVMAAVSYMGRTRRDRFPLGWCVAVALGPAAVAYGVPWLFVDPDVRVGVLVALWLVAGVATVYTERWLGRVLSVGPRPDAPSAEPSAAADRGRM